MNPAAYKLWMREQFPRLNQSLDEKLSADTLDRLGEEASPVTIAIAADLASNMRERFTYISMLQSAFYHHKKRTEELEIPIIAAFEVAFLLIETVMIGLAQEIGVEHRFLSAFY